jgi:hypothetical protein
MALIETLNRDVLKHIFSFIPEYAGILRLVNKFWKDTIDNSVKTPKVIIPTTILRGNNNMIIWAIQNYPDYYNIIMNMAIRSASPNILNRLLMSNHIISSLDSTLYNCLRENTSTAVDIAFKYWINANATIPKKSYNASEIIITQLNRKIVMCHTTGNINDLIESAVHGNQTKFIRDVLLTQTMYILRKEIVKQQDNDNICLSNKRPKTNTSYEILNVIEGYTNMWEKLMVNIGSEKKSQNQELITLMFDHINEFEYENFKQTNENPIFYQPLLNELIASNRFNDIKYFYSHPKVIAYFNILKQKDSLKYNNIMYESFMKQLAIAAHCGNLELIKWFHDYFKIIKIYQFGNAMMVEAIHLPNNENDDGDDILHEEVIQWIHANYNFPEFFSIELFSRAVRCSNTNFLQWLLDIGCSFDIESITQEAIKHEKHSTLEWLRTKIPNL